MTLQPVSNIGLVVEESRVYESCQARGRTRLT